MAVQDKGSPPLSSTTHVVIRVKDGDDLSPIFSKDVYEATVQEDYPITVSNSRSYDRCIFNSNDSVEEDYNVFE
jgi:hypothetical protein